MFEIMFEKLAMIALTMLVARKGLGSYDQE
jgi:hypothetical protein